MKRFELVIESDANGVRMTGQNDGFNVLEIMALLDVKKTDIMEQFTKCENFTSHRVAKVDGEWKEINRKGE